MSTAAPKKKRRKVPKSVMVVGGALLLGYILGNLIDPPGLGSGTMVSKGDGAQTPVDQKSDATPDEDVDHDFQSAGFITVLIDDRSYEFVKQDGEKVVYSHTELDDIVRQALEAPGNSNGIRVTILRRESARYSAETNLRTALTDAGVANEAIYMPKTFVQ